MKGENEIECGQLQAQFSAMPSASPIDIGPPRISSLSTAAVELAVDSSPFDRVGDLHLDSEFKGQYDLVDALIQSEDAIEQESVATTLSFDLSSPPESLQEEKTEHEAAELLMGEETLQVQDEERKIYQLAKAKTLRTTIIAHSLLILINILFSGFSTASKIALTNMHPLILLALRYSFATPLMLIGVLIFEGSIRPGWRGFFMIGLLGAFGIYVPQILFFKALSLTTATDATIFQMVVPPVTAVVAVLLKREKANVPKFLGVASSFAGAVTIIGIDGLDMNKKYLIGNLLIILMSGFSAFYYLFQQKLVEIHPPLMVSAIAFSFATVFSLITTAPMTESWKNLKNESLDGWLGLAYVTLFGTVLAYLILPWCLKKTSPLTASSYSTIQPLLAGILASFILGEEFNYFLLIGGFFILSGLVLIAFGRYKEQKLLDIARASEDIQKAKESVDHLTQFELDPIPIHTDFSPSDLPTNSNPIQPLLGDTFKEAADKGFDIEDDRSPLVA